MNKEDISWSYQQIGELANKFGSEGDYNSRVVANLLLDLRESLKYIPKENADKVRKMLKLF